MRRVRLSGRGSILDGGSLEDVVSVRRNKIEMCRQG